MQEGSWMGIAIGVSSHYGSFLNAAINLLNPAQ